MRTLQPSHTFPLKDRPTGCLVSTQTICMPPASNSYTVWLTCQLPVLVIVHTRSHWTPELYGILGVRPVPIRVHNPKPVHVGSPPPVPVCMCGGPPTGSHLVPCTAPHN